MIINNIFFNKPTKATVPVIVFLLITAIFVGSHANKVNAQAASAGSAGGAATGVLTVPVNTAYDFHSIMNYQKSFTLDRIATMIAKQILHQITASVINWINTGFKGNPTFLNNPEGFFLDVADQITGEYISGNGILKSLCTPFNLDIRLSLSAQSTFDNRRYACTLSQIIENQKNARVSIGVDVSTQHNTIDGFMNGDFSQGGWPAFISYTTVPQNNFVGAYLQAKSDLDQQIAHKQNSIRLDLQMGSGFLSMDSCKDVAIPGTMDGTVDPSNDLENSYAQAAIGGDPSVSKKTNANGTVTYQHCEVTTPGSVISSKLMTNVNSPEVQLELANDINAVINALMTEMVSKIIGTGLHSLSAGGSGGHPSYTSQLTAEAARTQEINAIQASSSAVANNIDGTIQTLTSYKDQYDQAAIAIADAETRLNNAKACYTTAKTNGTIVSMGSIYVDQELADIDKKLSDDVAPLKATVPGNQALASSQLTKLTAARSQLLKSNTLDASNAQSQIQVQIDLSTLVTDTQTNVMPRLQNALYDANNARSVDAASIKIETNCNSLTGH